MATRSATKLYDHALASSGIGIVQFGLLNAIKSNQGATVTHIAAALGLDRTTLTRNLAPLVAAGLVMQRPGADRRSTAVTITAQGLAAIGRATTGWRMAQARIEERLGREDTDCLNTLLERAIAVLAAPASSAAPEKDQ
jgi:DNA-binding MarR family transcriptional regulator